MKKKCSFQKKKKKVLQVFLFLGRFLKSLTLPTCCLFIIAVMATEGWIGLGETANLEGGGGGEREGGGGLWRLNGPEHAPICNQEQVSLGTVNKKKKKIRLLHT